MNCPLCNTQLETRADKYYFICSTCDARVKDKKYYLTPEQEKCRYEEHNNNVKDMCYQNFTAPITKTILQKFNLKHSGLDYGCGTGPVISTILQKKGYNVKLYDPLFHPDEGYLDHHYDYIFSCEVFEHFYQPATEIKKLISLLKPQGYLLFMTHLYDENTNFQNWYYRNDPTHVFIFTAKTINYIAENFNLSLEKLDNRLIIFKKISEKKV
ncbi:MAG: 2-polyprenyl-3-methyl-5-hydroxy-6-metoxy-1,4-benzoquinol methylase [Candidatus Cloacimonas sp. SDB]|nr:MAG: 2-polyprenyl-3-methyl-5-hydroxy-6-metoxy-1,4-benzoquinol methylase [Candidatus Cloacimonas sp. SDB]